MVREVLVLSDFEYYRPYYEILRTRSYQVFTFLKLREINEFIQFMLYPSSALWNLMATLGLESRAARQLFSVHQLELVEKTYFVKLLCPMGQSYKNQKKDLISSTGHGMPLLRYCRNLTIVSKTLWQILATKPSFGGTLLGLFVLCENVWLLPASFPPHGPGCSRWIQGHYK